MLRRVLWWTVRLVPLVVVVIGFAWLWSSRVDIDTIPQEAFHDEGTASSRVALTTCPKMHKVVVEPLDDDRVLPVLASYLPPPLGSGGKSEMQGFYDPKDGHIEITGGLARLSASMPNDTLRAFFYRTLRHEYGHAFLDDWMKSKKAAKGASELSALDAQHLDPKRLPAELQGPATEYRTMSATSYGQPYFTSSFGEFMAESYSRLLSGQEVPPQTEKFLMASAGK